MGRAPPGGQGAGSRGGDAGGGRETGLQVSVRFFTAHRIPHYLESEMSGKGNTGRKPGTGVADLREGTRDHTQGVAGCLGPPRGEKRERGGKGSSGR